MEPFLGQIMMVGFNFAPRGWAMCQGQLLPISQYSALFSLLGTIYGGDGRTTFALPDLRGRCAIGMNQGLGLSNRPQGQKLGVENVTLTTQEIPSHTHGLLASSSAGNSNSPTNNVLAAANMLVERGANPLPVNIYSNESPNASLGASIGSTGGSQAHTNMQPSIAMNYIIALQGIFPSRN